MKNLKLLPFLLIGFSLSFASCSDDDDDDVAIVTPTQNNNQQQNIAEIAIENDQTDSLVVALTHAELVSTFQGSGNFTVFAPTNMAFDNYIANTSGVNKITDINKNDLKNVLLYHVLNTEEKAMNLSDNIYLNTLNTQAPKNESTVLKINTTNGVMVNNMATVTTADVDASNGVIHLINSVIAPRNVAEIASNDNRFDSLVVALGASSANLVTTLSGSGPFTVFAPTNQAFVDLLATNTSWNQIADIPDTVLTPTLQYHVLNQNNQSAELRDNAVLNTLGSGMLTVDLSNGAKLESSSNQSVNIIITDVQGTNGVIHAIDAVLLR